MTRHATLTDTDLRAYLEDGFVTVRGVLTPVEIADLAAECDRLWSRVPLDRSDPRVQWRGHVDGSTVADRIDPVLDISPLFDRIAHDPWFCATAERVLGEPAAIFKAKLITKRPGTMGYGMHQDYPYWEFLGAPACDYLIAFVAIDRFDAASGATEMFRGYHGAHVPPPPEDPLDTDERLIDARRGVVLDLAPGDVTFMHSFTPHRSAPNRSEHSRRVLILTYVAARHGDLGARYERHRPKSTG
jgi:ectoine hydroxylase-related dioxygenase (phytanoyl-CoA dioxygenase family)